MTKTKSTKRALFSAVLALMLCIAMLVGTTYAWFTDSVTSGRNTIVSGNLDVELEYYDADTKAWDSVDTNTNVFSEELWEPGHTEVVYLKVKNAGSLALKYQLGVSVFSEVVGTNVYGEAFNLSDYLEFDVIDIDGEDDFFADRDEARKATVNAAFIKAGFSKTSALYARGDSAGVSEEYVAMVVYMPETVGNEANYMKDTTPPSINLGITLVATQFTAEDDSFGNDYDKDATYIVPWDASADTAWYTGDKTEYILTTAEQLAGLAQLVNGGKSFAGITISLGSNIDLANRPWTPIGVSDANFGGTLDGHHYVISNLNVNGTSGVGLVGIAGNAASIENITVENAVVNGNHYVGTILGYGYLSANSLAGCIVKNATVVCTPDENNDNGDKAGIIAGMAINGNIYNNKAIDSKVYAYRDFGGIVGCAQAENRSIQVYSNSAENVELIYVACDNYADGKVNQNMNAIVGRQNPTSGKTVTVAANNSAKNIVKNEDSVKIVDSVKEIKANETVYLEPGNYELSSVPEGATVIGTDGVVSTATLSGTLNNATVQNVHIKAGNAQRWAYSKGNLVFEDCTFEATSVYAIHYDGLNGANITYKNCTIIGWAAIGSGAAHVTFDGCKIYGNGRYGLIRLYSPSTIKNCVFDVSAVNTTDVYQDGIHAVDCVINVENVTNVNGAVEELFNTSGTGVIKTGSVSNVGNAASLKNAIANGGEIALSKDVAYSTAISNDADIDLKGNTFEATSTIELGNNADLTMTDGKYEVNSTFGHIDVRPSSADGSVVTFEDVDFSYNKKNKSYGPSTNRLGSVVELCATVEGAKSVVVFKNCTFDNAQVLIEGMSGKTGVVDVTFENCTFNALTSSAPIYVQNYVTGTLTVKGCTFNLECTSSTASAISVNSSSSTAITVVAENNTINAKAATPYTYDAEKGETEVDTIKVNGTPANIKLISIGGTTSTATEVGTVKTGIAQ